MPLLPSSAPFSSRTYTLEITLQPPSTTPPGIALYPPIVLFLHAFSPTGHEISIESELSSFFVQATLYPSRGVNPPPLAPPDTYLLSGRMSMSLETLSDYNASISGISNGWTGRNGADVQRPRFEEWERRKGCFAIFSELMINRPGEYRVGLTLFKIDSAGGGEVVKEVKTEVVRVEHQVVRSFGLGVDANTRRLLEYLRTRGASIP